MTRPLCPDCHLPLPAGSPDGHCPACLAGALFSVEDSSAGGTQEVESWGSIGGCDLLEELGRGGMGVVYRARQRALDRIVAVKILRDPRFATETERARFRREALAAGRMRHPGIVGVLDVGEEDGVPWLTMEYVDGMPLDRAPRMAPEQAARCMAAVAEAVEHAHGQGVLHRDLKPANILLDAAGQPRITDFGIAQFTTGESGLTRTGQALGSPGYGAPEQILRGQADERTDVYGLGATLYHLLTGRPPFTGQTTDAVLLDLRESDPIPPRRLEKNTPRDLETICLKCLRKQPENRYATAGEVAAELRRWLADEPIQARPAGIAERVWRWARRHPGIAALLTIVFLLLCAIAGGALLFARRQAASERRTVLLAHAREMRTENLSGTRTQILTDLRAAWTLRPGPDILTEATAAVSRHEISLLQTAPADSLPAAPGITSADGQYRLQREGDTWLVLDTKGETTARSGPWPGGAQAALDDRGTRLAIAPAQQNHVILLELPSGKTLHTLPHPNPVSALAWSGELLASGGSLDRMVHIWDTTTGQRLHRLPGHDAQLEALAFRRDGQELVSAARDGVIRVWHAGSGTELLRLENTRQHTGPAWWDTTGEKLHLPVADSKEVDILRIAWSPVQRILTPGADEPRSENIPGSLSLTQDASLASTVDETGVRLWSLTQGRTLATFPSDRSEWMSAALAPDASALWLSGWNRPFRRLAITTPLPGWQTTLPAVNSLRNSGPLIVHSLPSMNLFALINGDATLIDSWPPDKTILLPQQGSYSAAISPDGRYAVTGGHSEPDACLWQLPQGTMLRRLPHPGSVLGIAFAGDLLWLWGARGITRLHSGTWEPAAPYFDQTIYAMTVSPDGTLFAGTTRHDVVIHRAADMQEIHRLPVPAAAGRIGSATLVFNADSTTLALHTASGSLVLWNLPALRSALGELGMQ